MLTIIAGGKPSKNWLLAGIQEYEKRLKKPFDVHWLFTDDVEATTAKLLYKASGASTSKFLRTNNTSTSKLSRNSNTFLVLLDERGKNLSSPEFSKLLDQKFNNSIEVTLVIGGPYGFSDDFRAQADFLWSFSNLVFPHELMRLYLIEQIYRAQEISHGGKYHHP